MSGFGSILSPVHEACMDDVRPADAKIGSWDPNSVYWEEIDAFFVGALWGLKAELEVIEGSNPRKVRMKYPLNVTEVTYNSEAYMQGIQVRDVITAVRPDGAPGADFIKVTSVTDIDNRRLYVTDEVCGKPLPLAACRRSGGSNAWFPGEEHSDEGGGV